MSVIGIRIKHLRKSENWKQQELGDLLGVSPQVISNWERGYSFPDHADIVKLARLLRTTTDFLLGVVDEPMNNNFNSSENHNKNINLIKLLESKIDISIDDYTLGQLERKTLKAISYSVVELSSNISKEKTNN
jgi:transcriptional regulator with XRE-family HTH domain